MLILSRKPGESLIIGDEIKVTILDVRGNQVRIGIDAPPSVEIYREEVYEKVQKERSAQQGGILNGNLENEKDATEEVDTEI